jgi:perosamine synthetase
MTTPSSPNRIFYTKPSITELEIRYVNDAVTHGWGERCYDYIVRFEQALCEHLGVAHAIATSSCTGALHMGLAGLGIGEGDEVILADINWIASVAPVNYLKAVPVFVDILPDTWCLDPTAVEAAITPRTKAIIAVHLYGNLCHMDELLAIGHRRGIPVIEDAAEAIGSIWHGKRAGTMGTFGTFSFHGTKTLTTGEGGAFVTNDRALYERILTLSNHGRKRGEFRQFWSERIGFKYKMSNLQAAVGLAQIERIDELVGRKREIFEHYADALAGFPIVMNPEPSGTSNGYWMPTIVADEGIPFDREALLAAFKADDIDGRVFFWPLSSQPMFSPCLGNRISYSLHQRAVNLPSYHDITTSDIRRVTHCVTEFLKT